MAKCNEWRDELAELRPEPHARLCPRERGSTGSRGRPGGVQSGRAAAYSKVGPAGRTCSLSVRAERRNRTDMVRHIGWIIVVVAFAALAPGAAAGIEDIRPNVIVILADDLGPGDLSCYGGSIPTPQIDRMAKEGVRFTRYYSAAPICSPSRCGLITGQFLSFLPVAARFRSRSAFVKCPLLYDFR